MGTRLHNRQSKCPDLDTEQAEIDRKVGTEVVHTPISEIDQMVGTAGVELVNFTGVSEQVYSDMRGSAYQSEDVFSMCSVQCLRY